MAVLKNVKVLFSNVVNEDDFSGKYQIVVKLTEEQAADAEAQGVKVKTKEYQGDTQHQATFKTKYRPRVVGTDPKKDYDLEGSEIGRGSTVSVQYKERPWSAMGNSGVSQDLVAVQILDFAAPNSVEFEEEENGFGDESGEY